MSFRPLTIAFLLAASPGVAQVDEGGSAAGDSPSRLSDEAIGLQQEAVPERPGLILELGDPFLGKGPLNEGFEIPTGAFWSPNFQVFGTYRTLWIPNEE